jgi:hypothetical protein
MMDQEYEEKWKHMTHAPDASEVHVETITWKDMGTRNTAGLEPKQKGPPPEVKRGLTSTTLFV